MKRVNYVVCCNEDQTKTAVPVHELGIDAAEELFKLRRTKPAQDWKAYRVTTDVTEVEFVSVEKKK